MPVNTWRFGGLALLLAGGLMVVVRAEVPKAAPAPMPGIIPSGFGEAVDKDIARARAATMRFKDPAAAVAAGYAASTHCVENQPAGAMGLHYDNNALRDLTQDVEKPEVLVYEKTADGAIKLNGVEYIVPIAMWTKEEPPMMMGQKMKKAPGLGIWYLHVWTFEASPSGVFADWNPNVKCR
jgi:hypothetical protein